MIGHGDHLSLAACAAVVQSLVWLAPEKSTPVVSPDPRSFSEFSRLLRIVLYVISAHFASELLQIRVFFS
jgi:hypothetical protein